MTRDLIEVTVPQLEQMYREHKCTVTQVVRWYMARIEKYNGIYRAVQNVDVAGALATAAREDAEAKAGGSGFQRGPLWGVPIVTKANTSVKGLVTTDGWEGYMIPGHELIAPKDADIVARLRAAGAIIIGQTNMPDFAASDTNRRAPPMAAPATPTMCALARAALPAAPSPRSPQTSPFSETEQIPAIPFECRPRPVPWWAYSPLVAW
jgi:Asp-tRNA(Asn)/Glu-tRNA(Gln) amidotransferase A subunit family amidase